MADIRNIVAFSRDEKLIREYFGFKMYYPVKAKISLSVTNKRVIIYSSAKSILNFNQDALYQQINVDDVRGLEILNSKAYNFGAIVACGILLTAGFFSVLIGQNIVLFTLPGLVCLIGGILGIVFCLVFPKKLFKMQIKGITNNLNVGEFIEIKPVISSGPGLQKIAVELGALIIDIQERTI